MLCGSSGIRAPADDGALTLAAENARATHSEDERVEIEWEAREPSNCYGGGGNAKEARENKKPQNDKKKPALFSTAVQQKVRVVPSESASLLAALMPTSVRVVAVVVVVARNRLLGDKPSLGWRSRAC